MTLPLRRSKVRLSDQQLAVLVALAEHSPTPTTILRDVRVSYYDSKFRQCTYAIGEPVGGVLRRLEQRGLVCSERGHDCNDWWIMDEGRAAIGWVR